MTDLFVYVNDDVSCSVIIENCDVTLDTFRSETLEEQASDVLPFQYKFTRLLKNQRIVIGVKQEANVKLSQCMQKTDDHFSIYLLREEAINLKAKYEPDLNHATTKSEDGDQDQIPP